MGYLSTCSFRYIRLYQVCWDFIITLPHEMTWGKKSKIAKKDAREIQRVKLLIIPPLDLTSHTFCFGRILGCSVCAKSQTFKKYTLLTKFEKSLSENSTPRGHYQTFLVLAPTFLLKNWTGFFVVVVIVNRNISGLGNLILNFRYIWYTLHAFLRGYHLSYRGNAWTTQKFFKQDILSHIRYMKIADASSRKIQFTHNLFYNIESDFRSI